MGRPGYILAALALYVTSLFIAGARWRGFLRALGGDVGVGRAALATLGGISAGNLAPSSRLGGEACRVALVRLTGNATWRQATVAALWDRLSEVPPILVLGAMGVVAVGRLTSAWRPALLVGGLAFALIAAGLAVTRLLRSRSWLDGWRERLAIDRVRGRVFAMGVGYSALLWLQDVFRLTCAALAFGVTLAPTKIAALSILAMLGGLVPGIAGLGPVEGSLLTGLMAFGVDLPTAAAVTATERAISYGFSTSTGALAIALLGGRSLWMVSRPGQATAEKTAR
jgi:uncharacterized membrane protein YbhN (UPF0104 family)